MKTFRQGNKTFQEAINLQGSHPRIILTIEGYGNSQGLYRFCDQVPRYATSSLYKPLLTRHPNELESELDPLGGISKASQITFSLLDETTGSADPGLITLSLGNEEGAVGFVSGTIMSSSGSFIYTNNSGTITSGTIYYLDGEAVKATSTNTSVLSASIERAWLGTLASRHPVGTKIFRQNPITLGRKVSYYLGFDELSSSADERLLGSFYITDYQPNQRSHFSDWSFKATSKHDWFNRKVAGNIRFQGRLGSDGSGPAPGSHRKVILNNQRDNLLNGSFDQTNIALWNDKIFLRIGKELLQAELASAFGHVYIYPDGQNVLCDSPPDDRGLNADVKQVLISEVSQVAPGASEIESSFRVQEPGTEDSLGTSSSAWVKTDNPVDILLCVLTSPASRDDGLGFVNFTSGLGNWSSLPWGYGIGVPAENIDFESFLEVRERIFGVHLPYLVIEDAETFGEWADKNILKPYGLLLDISNDKITLKKPRSLVGFDDVSTITEDNILFDGNKISLDYSIETNSIASRVRFWRKADNNKMTEIIVKDTDFPSLFKVDNLTTFANKTIDLEVPGMGSTREGNAFLVEERAISLLSRVHRPYVVIGFWTDLSFYDLSNGDLIKLSVRHLPKPGRGRGFVAERCQIISKKFCLDPRQKVGIYWRVVWFNQGRQSVIAPSFNVLSTEGGGTRFVGTEQRFTFPNSISYLPESDTSAFRQGDVVRGRFRDGTDIGAGTTQIIIDVGSDYLELDGNFAGQYGDIDILEFAYYEEQNEDQQENFVSLGSARTLRVQSSGSIFSWGET